MNRTEIDSFFDRELLPRWKDWDPTGAEIADWTWHLGPFSYDLALRAVRVCKLESRWREPRMGDVIKFCKTNQPKQRYAVEKFEPNVFVQCIEGRTAGRYFPVLLGGDSTKDYPRQTYLKAGSVWVDLFAERGERWIFYTGMTDTEMRKRKREMASETLNSLPDCATEDEQAADPADTLITAELPF